MPTEKMYLCFLLFLTPAIGEPLAACPCDCRTHACPASCLSCEMVELPPCLCATECAMFGLCPLSATVVNESSAGCNSGTFLTCNTSCYRTATDCMMCKRGHFGPKCQSCPGFPAICGLHGKCLDGVKGSGVCECFPGYSGEECTRCDFMHLYYPLCITPMTLVAYGGVMIIVAGFLLKQCAPSPHWRLSESTPLFNSTKKDSVFSRVRSMDSVSAVSACSSFPRLSAVAMEKLELSRSQSFPPLFSSSSINFSCLKCQRRKRSVDMGSPCGSSNSLPQMIFGQSIRLSQIFFSADTITGTFSQGPFAGQPLSAWSWKEDSWPMQVVWHKNRWFSLNNRVLFCLKSKFPPEMDVLVEQSFATSKLTTTSQGIKIEVLDGEFQGSHTFAAPDPTDPSSSSSSSQETS